MTPEAFARERRMLHGLAYRLTGSAADADDVVQEAWLRVADVEAERSTRALLATVVTRLCLDEVRSARRRRETYVGPWLPEPLETPDEGDALDDAEHVSVAFVAMLDALNPLERAVYVLRELFDLDFADVAQAVDRSEAACRQALHRAREALEARRTKNVTPRARRDALAQRFFTALATGDVAALMETLADDVRAVADHGGRARSIRRPVCGADRVARLMLGLATKNGASSTAVARVNGALSLLVWEGAALTTVLSIEGDAERVAAVYLVRNPEKLARLGSVMAGLSGA